MDAGDLGAGDLGAGDLGAGDLGPGDLGAGDLVAAEEMGGLPGHGGPRDPAANLAALVDAARRLVADHSRLPGDLQVRLAPHPAYGDLLVVEVPDRRLPRVAFTFASGPVPLGTTAFTRPAGGDTADGAPILRITMSDSVPEADRPTVSRRVLVHEIGHAIEELRPRRFHERLRQRSAGWFGRDGFDPHETGLLDELWAELHAREADTAAARQSYDQRIGQILDRLDASDRMDRVVAYLQAAGRQSDVELVRALAGPDAPWRAEVGIARRAAAVSALSGALVDLSSDRVGLLEHGRVVRAGGDGPLVAQVGLRMGSGQPTRTADLPVGGLVDSLADSTGVGERLRARAAARLAAALAGAAGERAGQVWGEGPALAAARTLARLHEALPPDRAGEYQRALSASLDSLSSDQLLAIRDEPLPSSLRDGLPRRTTDALLAETLAALTGTAPGDLATAAQWRPDGRLSLTGNDGRVRPVPDVLLDQVRGWLRGRIADGTDLATVRAELVAVLGARLRPFSGARPGSSRFVGALAALGRLWVAPDLPAGARAAVEAMAGEVLAGHALRPQEWDALPPAARELVNTVPPVPRSRSTVDRYLGLRPRRHQALVREIGRRAAQLAAVPANDTTHVTELATSARRMAELLEEAVNGLEQRRDAKLTGAREAEREEDRLVDRALGELASGDMWAEERFRTTLREAEGQQRVAEHDLAGAVRYDGAREKARDALDAYRLVVLDLSELAAALPAGQWAERGRRLVEYTAGAAEAYQRYQDEVLRIQPAALDNAVPVRRLPHLGALAAKLNAMLAAKGLDATIQPEALQRELLSMWRWAAGDDGALISLADGAAQARVRFRHGDPVEVVDAAETGAELMLAQLPQFPQGSRVLGATMNRLLGLDLAADPGALLHQLGEHLSDVDLGGGLPLVAEALRHVVLRLDLEYSRRWSVGGEGAEFALPGAVTANRGTLPLFDVEGAWEASVRTADDASWPSPVTVDRGADGDRTGLQVVVPQPYTEPAPAPDRREQLDQPLTTRFPEHAVTLSGTEDLYASVVELLERAGARVSEPTRRWAFTLTQEEFPARLDQAINNPGGWHRDIRHDGRTIGIVRVKTTVVREEAEMLGASSRESFLELLRVSFAQATGTTLVEGRRGAGVEPGAGLVDGQGGTIASATVTASRGSVVSDGISVARVAIHPNVQRFTGHTQGYRLRLVHDVTVHLFDGGRTRETVEGRGVFRLPEREAYRYGLPVDARALRRDPSGEVVRGPDGNAVLRDDPLEGPPPGRVGRMPDWLGPLTGPGGGPVSLQRMTGVDPVREQLESRLREDGWLPAFDAEGFPIVSANRRVRAGQLANLRAVAELSASRLESDHEFGLNLIRVRTGREEEHLALRVRVRQGTAELVGHTDAEAVVNLDIGRQVFTRTGGETRNRAWGGRLGGGRAVGGGLAGERPTAVGAAWQVGEAVHQGTLVESHGPTAIFEVPHMLEVRRVSRDTDHGPLLAGGGLDGVGRGHVRVVVPGDLLAEAPPAQPPLPLPQRASGVSTRVLSELTLLHVDPTNVPEAVRKALPTAASPESAGYAHLAAFSNVRNLVADPSWMFSDYRTDHVVDPRGLSPRRSSLTIRGLVHDLSFETAAGLVTADINLSMDVHSLTARRQQAVAGTAGGAASFAEGSGGRTTLAGVDLTDELIMGRERLDPVAGIHYVFSGLADLTITGVEHHSLPGGRDRSTPVTLESVSVAGVMAERRALMLYADGELAVPLERVEDALVRAGTGRLELGRDLERRVRQRLGADLAAVAGEEPGATGAAVPATGASVPQNPAEAAVDATSWRLPEHLRRALGQAGAEPVRLVDARGRPVALFDEVMRHIEAVSPHAADRLPGLRMGLAGQLAGRAWSGKLERMLRPEGWVFDIPVPVGRYGLEHLRIELAATFVPVVGDHGPVEGRHVGAAPEVGSILQDYGFDQTVSGQFRGSAHRAAGSGRDVPVGFHAPDLSAEASRGYTGRSSVGAQATRIQRLSSFDGVDRFERPVEVTITVSRRPARTVSGRLGQGLRTVAGNGRGESTGVVSGTVIQRVPKGLLIHDAGAGEESSPAPVPAMVGLPDRFVAETVDLGDLRSAVRDLLARGTLLGKKGMDAHDAKLSRALSALASDAGLEWMATPGGHPMVTFPRPGHPDQQVRVFIEAQLTGHRIVAHGRPEAELGHDTRQQRVVSERDEFDRPLPATRSVGDELDTTGEPWGGYRRGLSAGESLQLVIGDRDEHKAWQRGPVSTIAVDLTFHVTVVTRTVLAGGTVREDTGLRVPEAATGHGYLTVFDSELSEGGSGAAESIAPRWRMDDPDEGGPGARRSWPRGWWRRRSDAPTVDLDDLVVAAATRPGEVPQPAVVAGLLQRQLGTGWRTVPVLHLTARAAAGHGVDPLPVAVEVARQIAGEVTVDVQEPDGSLSPYRVLPDGTVAPGYPDDGFLAARASLPADLVERAYRAGLSLHTLFRESAGQGRTFTDVVDGAVRGRERPDGDR